MVLQKLLQCDVVAVAVLGFFVIGLVSLGCVGFGVYEITTRDAIFNNNGLGEVLTVLGLYFTLPYLTILGAFIAVVFQLKCSCFSKVHSTYIIIALVAFMIVGQQAVTDAYLYLLLGPYSLFILALDIVVFGLIVYFRLSPVSGYCYVALYAIKMALQWDDAYELKDQPFFGPNGQVAMMFLCIPIIQLPLYVSTLAEGSGNLVDVFVGNFNLFLTHLLHSLDIISLFLFAFTPPYATTETEKCPAPLRWLILIQVVVGFIANNSSLLHLFFQRQGGADAEIAFLPKNFRDASSRADNEAHDDTVDDVARSHHRRIFQYFLLMLVTVDAPFFVTRIQLWQHRYYSLDLFVAKNVKDLVDVAMLLLRTDKQRERLALES